MDRSLTALGGIAILVGAGCAAAPPRDRSADGVRELGPRVVEHRGPDLLVTVGTPAARAALGDDWLVLGVRLAGAGGSVAVHRSDITAETPDGRRLPLIDQDAFDEGYGRHRLAVERAAGLFREPLWLDPVQRPCERWFLTAPFDGLPHDEVFVSSFRVCAGPLVFDVPGGVQPGRWRLRVELEESEAVIPFVLTAA